MPGVAALVVVAAGYDYLAVRRRWQTISGGVRQVRCSPWGRLATAAAAAVLLVHLCEA